MLRSLHQPPSFSGAIQERRLSLLIPACRGRAGAGTSSLSLSRRRVASLIWRLLKAVQIGGYGYCYRVSAVTAADICMPYLVIYLHTSTRSESLMGSRAELITGLAMLHVAS